MTAPGSPEQRRRLLAERAGFDRLSIFVPAVMSVSLLFWLLGELRNVAAARRERTSSKRAALAGVAIAAELGDATETVEPGQRGLHERVVYLLDGLLLWGAALYVAVGSVANYARSGGYVSDIAWLLALSLAVAGGCAAFGAVALATYVHYPEVPPGALRMVRASALSTEPSSAAAGRRAGWRLTATSFALWAAFAITAMLVGWSPHRIQRLDEEVAQWVGRHPLPGPDTWLDLIGSTPWGLAVAAAASLFAYRCRVLLATTLGTLVIGQLGGRLIRSLAARPRPPDGALAGRFDSFPSGHLVLLTVLAGMVPLVAAAAARRPWIAAPLRVLFAAVVFIVAVHRVETAAHWPLDVLGSLLLGAALVATAEGQLRRVDRHDRCGERCGWRAVDPASSAARQAAGARPVTYTGAIDVPASAAARVRLAAHGTASLAAVGLAALSFTHGLPTNPEASGLGGALQRPVQLALAAVVSIAALAGWRWPVLGALLLAVSASGLGLFAAVEYRPVYTVLLTAALLIPAVLLWFSWQHRRRPWEIVAVGVVASVLVSGTWVGAAGLYDSYFGPTHPTSRTAALAVDRVEWAWSGALTSDSVRVAAKLADGRDQAVLVATSERDGSVVRSAPMAADSASLVSLQLAGLSPDTGYRAVVHVDGAADRGRGVVRFHTPGVGRYSFRVAVASCARTGSNGVVFDALAEADPLLYLQLGDLHYENLSATEPAPFITAIGRALTSPAQAALYRQVPTAYVWDDHDYGANDAGAASPTRPAARLAYRAAVPHYELPLEEGPIAQAFTIGRVRFVLTDGRSERTGTSLLGSGQRDWLIEELTSASRDHALVVWANSTPWIGVARPEADTWAAFAEERSLIGQALYDAGVDNLVMVSGDAHMVAIDDGTNSGYAAGGAGGFPVLQAAALDRPGSVKGGPYSEGAFPGGGQFGLVDIDDHGDTIDVRLTGKRWDGTTLVTLERRFAVD